MGNRQSSEQQDAKSPSSSPSTPSRRNRERNRDVSQSRVTSTSGHSGATKGQAQRTYTPPTNLIPPSSSAASTSVSNTTATASPASSFHSRHRSQTASTPKTSSAEMGNADSKPERPSSRSSTFPPESDKPRPSPLSQPVDVPQPAFHDGGFDVQGDLTPPTSPGAFGIANSFSRPPRLPLPIERDPEPPSPIIAPQDLQQPVDENDSFLPSRASLLSSTTLDEDDAADIEQFAIETDPLAQKVPTTFTWKGHASSVYVTGTFAKWEKKFRMSKDKDGVFTATIPLSPGTHHITFLVDGSPITSRDLPTTVDFTNSLINYIEVAPQSPGEDKQPAEPVPIPGATASADGTAAHAGTPLDIRTKGEVSATGDTASSTLQDTAKQTAPTQPSQQPPHPTTQDDQSTQPRPAIRQNLPRPKYTSEIPDVLLHLDLYNTPEDERYKRSAKALEHLPRPPSLPMFMSKSILNATTPHKDDASVLTMPNHTVLNHLATSSIRNNVLATSGTTRYKRKFLTTIMYKPTHDETST